MFKSLQATFLPVPLLLTCEMPHTSVLPKNNFKSHKHYKHMSINILPVSHLSLTPWPCWKCTTLLGTALQTCWSLLRLYNVQSLGPQHFTILQFIYFICLWVSKMRSHGVGGWREDKLEAWDSWFGWLSTTFILGCNMGHVSLHTWASVSSLSGILLIR